MTQTQKQALKMMANENIGAMLTKFGWTWPVTVERNELAAVEVVRILSARMVAHV
jgi:hypothetical protein